MKAVTYSRYGGPEVLRLTEVPQPQPAGDEVLVKLHAVGLNLSDWETLRGKPLYSRIGGPFKPAKHILGSDIAGTVTATGPDVTLFQPGDRVFADILYRKGGFAEYVCVPEKELAPIPDGLSFEQAAALPQSAAIAWQGIKEKGLAGPGKRVLVNGAGGGTGMFAIQLAKLLGAEVTGVDNAEKQEFMRSVGADHVMDYRREDYTRSGAYDLVLDLAAYRSMRDYRRVVAPEGRYLLVGGSMRTLLGVALLGPMSRKHIRVLAVRLGVQHALPLAELCRDGSVSVAVDRRFALEEVPEALRYLGEGHAKGKILITVD